MYNDDDKDSNLAGVDEVEWFIEERRDHFLDEVTKAHPRMEWWKLEELAEEMGEDDEYLQELDWILDKLKEIQSCMEEKQYAILDELKEKRPGLEGWQYRMCIDETLKGDDEYDNLWSQYDSLMREYEYVKTHIEEECA